MLFKQTLSQHRTLSLYIGMLLFLSTISLVTAGTVKTQRVYGTHRYRKTSQSSLRAYNLLQPDDIQTTPSIFNTPSDANGQLSPSPSPIIVGPANDLFQNLMNTSGTDPAGDHIDNNEQEQGDSGTIKPFDHSTVENEDGPLFVNVHGGKYYGGLKLLHHNLLSSQVCRLLNPCITENGTLLLPRWIRRHDDIITGSCNIENVEFTLNDSSPLSSSSSSQTKYLPFDIFGLATPRYHMPHFLRDFIPNLISFDTVYGHRMLTKTSHTRRGRNLDDFPIHDQNVKPYIFLHPRVKLIGENSWVQQFVKLLPPKSYKNTSGPSILYMSDLFTPNLDHVCFRSAYLAKPAPAGTLIDLELLNTHPLFRSNNIAKTQKTTTFTDASDSSGEDTQCTLNVTILGRKFDENVPNYAQGRQIANVNELKTALEEVSEKQFNISFKITPVFFEGKTINEQINTMQDTDILIASHGAGITNILFMHRGSSLVELQPFEYYPDTYEELARNIADVHYDVSIAEPDIDAFESCITHYSKPGNVQYERLQGYLKKFKTAAERYKAAKSTHALQLHRLDHYSDFYLRVCARAQKLKIDVNQVVEQVTRLAARQCEVG